MATTVRRRRPRYWWCRRWRRKGLGSRLFADDEEGSVTFRVSTMSQVVVEVRTEVEVVAEVGTMAEVVVGLSLSGGGWKWL